jgi:hypothetical protein
MAHPNRSKRGKGNKKSGGITKTDLFHMGNIATGGNLGLAKKIYNTYSGWNRGGGAGGGTLSVSKNKKLKSK